MLGLVAGLTLLASPAAAAKTVTLRAYLLECADADPGQISAAFETASVILSSACAIRLSLAANVELKGGCQLPDDRSSLKLALRKLADPLKAAHPRDLALFILPAGSEARLSYAWIDASKNASCHSPRHPHWLSRFGVLFLTDFGLKSAAILDRGRQDEPDTGPAFAGILLAHEVLHTLTQRPHPTRLAAGHLMADLLGEMGGVIDPGWCACARQSPYVRP